MEHARRSFQLEKANEVVRGTFIRNLQRALPDAKVCSTNRKMLPKSWRSLLTYPAGVYAEMTTRGTRNPY